MYSFHTSLTSSLSKWFLNSSNFLKIYTSLSRNSTKLNGDLYPTLGSLGQFVFTHINLKIFNLQTSLKVNRYSNQGKNSFSFILWSNNAQNFTNSKTIVRNITSYFSDHQRRDLMSLTSNWYYLKIKNSLLINSFASSFIFVICSKRSKLQAWSKISWST